MIYKTPKPTRSLTTLLGELDHLRGRLGDATHGEMQWLGTLRRQVRATTVEGSTSIEGYTVPRDELVGLVNDDTSPPSGDADRMAVAWYARAMDHVGVMASDPVFRWLDRVILDLHFDACFFQRDKSPGRWREGPVRVTGSAGATAYTGPDADQVVPLMAEVVEWLHDESDAHVVVRGAMAHLHVVSVHPFEDGNGRIARIVQSLVLALGGRLAPEFGSIEEWLGHHTNEYYAALQEVQGGGYQPRRDASAWVEFCVRAHLEQAQARLDLIDRTAARWGTLEQVAANRGWPDRLVIAMEQSLMDRTDRARYAGEAGISDATASGDLRRLLDAGLVEQAGQGRNTRYRASEQLREIVGSDA